MEQSSPSQRSGTSSSPSVCVGKRPLKNVWSSDRGHLPKLDEANIRLKRAREEAGMWGVTCKEGQAQHTRKAEETSARAERRGDESNPELVWVLGWSLPPFPPNWFEVWGGSKPPFSLPPSLPRLKT